MADKEQSKKRTDQATQDKDYPKDQQPQYPAGQTGQGQDDQLKQNPVPEQEPQGQKQEGPKQEQPKQKDNSGKPKPEDPKKGKETGQPPPTCLKDYSVGKDLEEQKWKYQIDQIESKCNQSLAECLKKSNEDSLKLLNDVETAVNKYRDDYEKLKNKLDCMKINNNSALKDVLSSHSSEIEPIIAEAIQKIKELESCKKKLECAVDGKDSDGSDQEQDEPQGTPQDVPKDGDPVVIDENQRVGTSRKGQGNPGNDYKSKDECDEGGKGEDAEGGNGGEGDNGQKDKTDLDCNYDDYPLLTEKPNIELRCSTADRPKLMTLMTAKDELQRSGRYHDTMEFDFNEAKNTQSKIEDSLKKITDLQTKAQKARDDGKICQFSAYTLLIKEIIKETEQKLIKTNILNSNMSNALKMLVDAKKDKCYREYTHCKIEAMVELVNKTLDDARKSRDENILKRIVSNRNLERRPNHA